MYTCNTTVMKKPETNKKPEGTLSGTAKTLIDPEVGTEEIKEALMDPEENPYVTFNGKTK